jgi:hypothetical protein
MELKRAKKQINRKQESPKPRKLGRPKKVGRKKKYTPSWIKAEAGRFERWLDNREHSVIILFNEFALHRGYNPDRFSGWAKESDEFRRVYRRAKKMQEVKFIKGAVLGVLNQHFVTFLLKCQHGYTEQMAEQSFVLKGDKHNPIHSTTTVLPDQPEVDEESRAVEVINILEANSGFQGVQQEVYSVDTKQANQQFTALPS